VSDYNRFQRNRYGDNQEYAQVQEKELAEKVAVFGEVWNGGAWWCMTVYSTCVKMVAREA